MAVKIRLARWGAKKRPYYHIVAANSTSPRDGKFLKTLGKYDPMQETMDKKIINLDKEAVKYWLGVGAQPTEGVVKILAHAGLIEKKVFTEKNKKHLPKAKAQERLKIEEEAKKAALEAANTKSEIKTTAEDTAESTTPTE